ncbi:MAG: flagellar filament capping protein FliD [Myxococcales bacterium]|nr:flagellar filament capping protein FliD [Myxococcales bacterium]
MGIRIGSGLASGIDTENLISQLIAAESRPTVLLQRRKTKISQVQTAYRNIQGLLDGLKTAAVKIQDATQLAAYTASSSKESLVTASASGAATAATFQVEVQSLATAERERSNGFADKDTTSVGTGTFAIIVGQGTADEETIEIDVASDDATLQGLADAINAQTDQVSATVINTNDGTATPYRLLISGNETGANQTLDFDTSGLSGGTAPTFTETQGAGDAHIVLDGLDIYSATNQVTDLIPGVTLDLHSAEIGTNVDIEIATNRDQVKSNIQDFVDAYNAVSKELTALTRYNADTKDAGLLQGDSTAESIKRGLRTLVSSQISDPSFQGAYTALGQVGIRTDASGNLAIDSEDLDAALESNFNDVILLFEDQGKGETESSQGFADSTSTTVGTGTFDIVVNAGTETEHTISVSVGSGDDTLAGLAAAINAQTNEARATVVDTGDGSGSPFKLVIEATDTDASIAFDTSGLSGGAATIAFTQVQPNGFGVQFESVANDFSDPYSGLISTRLNGLDDTSADLSRRIDGAQLRLSATEARLRRQFTVMEQLIAGLQNQQGSLSSLSKSYF